MFNYIQNWFRGRMNHVLTTVLVASQLVYGETCSLLLCAVTPQELKMTCVRWHVWLTRWWSSTACATASARFPSRTQRSKVLSDGVLSARACRSRWTMWVVNSGFTSVLAYINTLWLPTLWALFITLNYCSRIWLLSHLFTSGRHSEVVSHHSVNKWYCYFRRPRCW